MPDVCTIRNIRAPKLHLGLPATGRNTHSSKARKLRLRPKTVTSIKFTLRESRSELNSLSLYVPSTFSPHNGTFSGKLLFCLASKSQRTETISQRTQKINSTGLGHFPVVSFWGINKPLFSTGAQIMLYLRK